MIILHYFLGFPPYRTGGLTKFAFDLMKSQALDNSKVIALWPGEIKNYKASPKIKERKKISNIKNFELVNSLPISLDEGINEFEAYTRFCEIEIYINFLKKIAPNVIHLHTLMGLHKEFILAANKLGIRIIMTSHDYFGICPKVNLYRYGKCCIDDNECRDCIQCNLTPLSLKKIQIMQSPIYRLLKENYIVKLLRKKHREKFYLEKIIPKLPDVNIEDLAEKYRKLRRYYIEMYEKIDFIHFNSTVTEKIYKKYIKPKNSKVISITHQEIKEHQRTRAKNEKKIILYLAPAKPYKGWNVLKEACDQLWREGEKIELRVFSPVMNPSPYMIIKSNGFKYSELFKIMNEGDVLVAPSIWYETFGFTVLEALSYKVPVIVSDHVGAKDIIKNNGIIVKAGDINELKNAIKTINIDVDIQLKSWNEFLGEIYEIYGEKYDN